MHGTVLRRDGALWVLYRSTFETEPIERSLWWRVLRVTGYVEDGDRATYTGSGVWAVRSSTVWTGPGDTQAEKIEDVSVSAPPSRGKAMRWNRGRWERLLKRGWVPA